MSLRMYEKLVPVAAIIREIMEEMEDSHIGFEDEREVDESQFFQLETAIEQVLNVYTEDQVKVIKMIVNYEMGYEPKVSQ